MKVFVDTNVWLAGLFRPGLCAELLESLIELDIEILLDQRVLAEFRRIARDKLRVDAEILAEAERFFRHHAKLLSTASQAAPDIPDADDAWIVAAALAADADWFVTGDKPLQDLGSVGAMQIVSPRAAFLRLRGLE